MNFSANTTKDLIDIFKDIKIQRWTEDEISLLQRKIQQGSSIEDVAQALNRSVPAIFSKANQFGYGYKTNKDDGLKYFTENINHKHRRTKDEIQEGKEFLSLPSKSEDLPDEDIRLDTDIIPKVEISLVDIDILIQILTEVRKKAFLSRTRSSTVGGVK